MSKDALERPKGGIKGDQARKARLAEELRQNLVRRKTRARNIGKAGAARADKAPGAADETGER